MKINKDIGLRDLRQLCDSRDQAESEIRRRLWRLRQAGVPLKELGDAVGLSVSQVSRLTSPPPPIGGDLPAATAMELLDMAERGEISHDQLVELLKIWPYEVQYVTTSLIDDYENRPNSFDAVEIAFSPRHLISLEECREITNAAKVPPTR